ncbi:Dimeric alpha-beta barrel [Spartinivicinus poritis]|uniref:Dimeric alpha-beta barrel n=1 Tax=Spartinivicinus poritis TaxID=2994640 RepID=A0ABT5UEQ0_9GAMM|nr:Dimeric alpha-beta barrel [Spartinivicinus sp. A2-2]MDE1464855.1 Dimeric alpha-beta barrel [Spartinivicinus sp. A2-2]
MNQLTVVTQKTIDNTLEQKANGKKLALVFHLKVKDYSAYQQWLVNSNKQLGGRQLFQIAIDPAPREGMLIDQLIINEYPSAQSALAFMAKFGSTLQSICSVYEVLAIVPEPAMTFYMVKVISWLVRLFKGVKDKRPLAANWTADNVAVWPDEKQMNVARKQNLNKALFVYNLNKYKTVANYPESENIDSLVSGQVAYDRYAKIAGFELLRRGAYPVYGGKPICLLESSQGSMLVDSWDKFIFVRYPQRRDLLAIIESDEFNNGQIHRDAGLERVAIFMGS